MDLLLSNKVAIGGAVNAALMNLTKACSSGVRDGVRVNTVAFLASPQAARESVQGAILDVDGGATRTL
ncbi:MAG TPA: hypothetical protein VI753_16570 [Anaerolineales bacterium]|nr:hypothetical protein [Anaerolineales bacterium]